MFTSQPPERELLLCTARVELTPARAARVATLASLPDLDWEALAALAARHRLLPLLTHHLGERAPPLLRVRFAENTRAMLRVLHETLSLATHLEEHGVPTLPFKGPTLATALYGGPNLRQVGDLDVIVRREDVGTAVRLLGEAGYRPTVALTPGLERRLLRDGHHLSLRRSDGMLVELHWTIAKRAFAYPVRMEEVWRRSVTARMGRQTWRVLAPEDLLPILAIQGSKEMWRTLERACALAEAARRLPAEQWEASRQAAEAWRAGRTLRVGLLLAERLLGAGIPAPLAAWAGGDPAAARLAVGAADRLFRPAGSVELLRYQVGVRETLPRKGAFLLAGAFTAGAGEWRAADLPPFLEWSYPLLRPFRLALRYLRRPRR